MNGDMRINAFIAAHKGFNAAVELATKFRKGCPDPETPLPSDFWALVAVAQGRATLASSESAVGMLAADILAEEERSEAHQRKVFGDMARAEASDVPGDDESYR